MSKLSPALPLPKDDSPALGGDRAIKLCAIHGTRMVRNLFGDHVCLTCIAPDRRVIHVAAMPLPTDPDWFTAGKLTPKTLIARVRAGLHPMGGKLSDDPAARCGTCKHRVHIEHNTKSFYKCGWMRQHWTHGPATDIKLRWQGCNQWAEGQGTQAY